MGVKRAFHLEQNKIELFYLELLRKTHEYNR